MLRKLGLSALSLILALGALEAFLRVRFADRFYVWPPYWQRTMQPDPEAIPGIYGPSRLRINGLGMRAGPFGPDGQYRLLAVGGSTTICSYLDDEETWTHLVQERVNAALGPDTLWVGNVGRPAHSTPQHVFQVEKLLDQNPEIDGVLLLVGINDLLLRLELRLRGFRMPTPDEVLKQSFAFPGWDPQSPWYLRTGLGRFWQTRQWWPWRGVRGDRRLQDDTGSNVALWRWHRQQASRFKEELPPLSQALSNYRWNLQTIVNLARARNARVLFITQPTLWRPDLSPEEEKRLGMGGPGFLQEGAEYYSAAALAEGMELYNESLRRVCQEQRVECIDAAVKLPKDTSIFYDDAHFTEEGARQLARIVSDHLLEHEPFADRRGGAH